MHENAQKSMTTRARQRKAPVNDETPASDAENATRRDLDGDGAHLLLSGDEESTGEESDHRWAVHRRWWGR